MHVLIAALGSLGDLHPHLALALALTDRGHRVTFATSEAYRERVECFGLPFLAMPPDVPDVRKQPGLVRAMMDPRRGTERVVRELVLPSVEDAWRAVEPIAAASDVVIVGLLAFAARLAAEFHGVPWVSTALQPSVMFSAADPSLISGLPAAEAVRRLPLPLQKVALATAGLLADRWMEPLAQLRDQLGLGPFSGSPLLRGQHSPVLSVALFSPRFAPGMPDWPAGVVECGFPFDRRIDGGELSAGLEAFLASGPPPAVFTLGSAASLEPGDFIEVSARAAIEVGARAVILSGKDGPRGPYLAADSIWLEPWAPHAVVFPRSWAVVHQGGIGTLSHALASGRPMLVVPHAHDQPDNARRAAALGVARVLPRVRYRADRAAGELRELARNPAYSSRARTLAPVIARERGAEVAAVAIESVVTGMAHVT